MVLRTVVTGNPPLGHCVALVANSVAQAGLPGVQVAAASVAAAQRLLAPAAPAATPAQVADQPAAVPGKRVRRTRTRKPEPEVDLESMVRQVVAKANEGGEAKVARMRTAIQRAIEVLRVAVE